MLDGDLLDDHLVGHNGVRHGQRLVVAQVDLMLRGAELVVRVLDGDAHLLEREDGVTAQVAGIVERGEVEVAPVSSTSVPAESLK